MLGLVTSILLISDACLVMGTSTTVILILRWIMNSVS